MKITGITPHVVGNSWKDWLLVRVDTDEGIHGVGEGTVNVFARTVEAAILELEERIAGHDPFDIEALLLAMQRDVYTDGGQVHGAAVAAVEIACWDIMGKALDLPVYKLLGGRLRDRVRAYASDNLWGQRLVHRGPQPRGVRRGGPRGGGPGLHGHEVRSVRSGLDGPERPGRGPVNLPR